MKSLTILGLIKGLAPEIAITDSEYDYCVHCGATMLGGDGRRKTHKPGCPWVMGRELVDRLRGKVILPRVKYKNNYGTLVKREANPQSGYANKRLFGVILDNGRYLQVPEWKFFGVIEYDEDYEEE